MANRLWVWNYNTSFSSYLTPFPNLYVRGPNIRYMIANNVRGIFEQDVYNTPHGCFSPLSGYLGAKLLWNPNYDTDLAINEFLSGVYAEAATPLRLYLDLFHDAVKDPATRMGIWIGPDAAFLTDAIMERADTLMDAAEKAVAHRPEVLERVRIARLSTDFTILERVRALGSGAFEYDHSRFTVKPSEDFRKRADRFFETAERHGLLCIRESGGALDEYKQAVYAYMEPRQLTPREPRELPGNAVPGMTYRYYEGQFEKLPDFSLLAPVAEGVVPQPDLSPAQGKNASSYALVYEGYIRVPADGVYTFSARSNDGSRIYIDEALVVDNDGLHSETVKTSFQALRQGCYPIRIAYFQGGESAVLSVHYAGPDIPYQILPSESLFHVQP